MALIRSSFEALTSEQLRILINDSASFMREVAGFPECTKRLNQIEETLAKTTSKSILQDVYAKFVSLIDYYDKNQSSNGLFKPVQNNIIARKLDEILKLMPAQQATLAPNLTGKRS